METIQIIPNTAAMQLKYNYAQLDSTTAIMTRGAAVEIKAHAEHAKSSMITIGQRLTEVKALLQHGQFEDWCQVEFDMSQRTAQRMMAAAEVFGGKSDTVSLLSDSAMYMLSAPSVPEAARVEVIEQAQETGQSPTKAEVQAVLDKHKPPKPEPQPDRPATPETEEERSNRIRQKLRDDMDGYLARKFAAGSPPPDRPLLGWVADEPDRPAVPEATPTAIVLELPPIPFPDKDLLIGQVKRAVGILNEEGFATAADLLRVAGRCAYDAQEAASLPVDVEPVVTAKVRTANGEGEVGREFLINLTISSFKVALDSLDDYGRLTGHFTDIPPAQRILEKIIKNLQDNLT